MKEKMIFTDMDGTVLNQQKELSHVNLKAIHEASKNGVPIIFSTGRLWTATKPYYREAGLSTPLSACNGAVILLPNTMEILNEIPLPNDVLRQILEILLEENIYHHLYSLDTIFSKEYSYTTAYYEERNRNLSSKEDLVRIVMVKEFFSVATSDCSVYKVMACSDHEEDLQRCHQKLEGICGIGITRSGKENLEIMAKESNKGAALQFLCRYFNRQEKHVMAIGDERNDIPMLQRAGFSVAMGNASDEIKSITHYTAPSCQQNGFADAVYKYLKR